MKYITAALILTLSTLCVYGQHTDKLVKDAYGDCYVSNISPEEALRVALRSAKEHALRLAGAVERISIGAGTRTDNVSVTFNEITHGVKSGTIVDYKVIYSLIEPARIETGESILIAKVSIDATVRIHDRQPDPTFKIRVRGVRPAYGEGDRLTFSVTPHQEGYIKIFIFEHGTEGYLLYPNQYESNRIFLAQETVDFPISNVMEYILTKEDPAKEAEHNVMFIVFTKDNVPFTGNDSDMFSVQNWLGMLDPSRHDLVIRSYYINRKQQYR